MAATQAPQADSWAATQGRILALAWPIIVSNITVPLLGLVDTAVLGHLPDAGHLAAVALGSQLFTLLFWSFGFLRMGTTALVAQASGRRDQAAVLQVLQRALWLVLPLVPGLVLLAWVLWPILLPLMGGSAALNQEALTYLHIRLLATPAVLVQYSLMGWFIGQGLTRIPLVMLVYANLVNAVLDVVFVYGLQLTSDGVAYATVIADYSGASLGLWFALRQGLKGLGPLPAWAAMAATVRVNQHLFVRTLCLLAVFAFFTAQGARQGEMILATNAMLITLLLLISNALDGFAHAAESLTGQALGENHLVRLRRSIWASGISSAVLAAALSLFFWLAGPWLLQRLTDNPELQASLAQYQVFLFFLPLVGFLSYWLDGVLVGAGATAAMRNVMLAAALLCFLPLWWWLQPWGNTGLWWAFYGFLLARGLLMLWPMFQVLRQPQKFRQMH